MIFEKSSTRTRVSFETGLFQLDGHALFLSSRDIQLERGESIKATARVLSRYVDGIMIRTFAQSDVEQLAEFASVPVINGLTDYCYPCQVLADLMMVRERKKRWKGRKFAILVTATIWPTVCWWAGYAWEYRCRWPRRTAISRTRRRWQ